MSVSLSLSLSPLLFSLSPSSLLPPDSLSLSISPFALFPPLPLQSGRECVVIFFTRDDFVCRPWRCLLRKTRKPPLKALTWLSGARIVSRTFGYLLRFQDDLRMKQRENRSTQGTLRVARCFDVLRTCAVDRVGCPQHKPRHFFTVSRGHLTMSWSACPFFMVHMNSSRGISQFFLERRPELQNMRVSTISSSWTKTFLV